MDAIAQWRFDEILDTVRPQDLAGHVADLHDVFGTMPTVVDALTGRGRQTGISPFRAFTAIDRVSAASLVTRDMSVQAILWIDFDGQNAQGSPGAIYQRGARTGATERCSALVDVRVVNVGARVLELRWSWDDMTPTFQTLVGGQFVAPLTGFYMLTATRRWISPTLVVCRYYMNGQLLAEVPSSAGGINGSADGTTYVGCASDNVGSLGSPLVGIVDELRVLARELAAEEIAMTWRRITEIQPRAYQLVRELHGPGFPISSDPTSRVQRETNMWGNGLGFAAAQAENLRDNLLPDRAYGAILERWEAITNVRPLAIDSLAARRARVIGRLRARSGVSVGAVANALKEVAVCDPSQLQILGFNQDTKDGFTADEMWRVDPPGQFTRAASTLRVQAAAAADIDFIGSATSVKRNWYTAITPIANAGKQVPGRSAECIAKITPTLVPSTGEVGVFFGDLAAGNFILVGLRNAGGTYQIVFEPFASWRLGASVVVRTLGGLVPVWLNVANTGVPINTAWDPVAGYTWLVGSSIVSASSGWINTIQSGVFPAPNTHGGPQWWGLYARGTAGALPGALDATFSETWLRARYGDRSLNWYAYRDPAIPGTPDLVAAHNLIQVLKHAHTNATIITSKSLRCDDSSSGCDRGPMGAI